MRRDDALDGPLQACVERRLDPARPILARPREHALDEVRRQQPRRIATEAHALVARDRIRGCLEPAAIVHHAQDVQRARPRGRGIAPRVVARRLLRQGRQKRRFRRRQRRRRPAEVRLRRALRALNLIAVRREVQIEREDLVLRQPMFEPQRDDRLIDLGRPPAPRPGPGLTRQQQLGDLLRDRRSALDDAPALQIVHGRAHERDRIEPDMRAEAHVFGRERRERQRPRQLAGRDRLAALPARRPHLRQPLAVPIDDHRRRPLIVIEQARRKRAASQPHRGGDDDDQRRRNSRAPPDEAHEYPHCQCPIAQ